MYIKSTSLKLMLYIENARITIPHNVTHRETLKLQRNHGPRSNGKGDGINSLEEGLGNTFKESSIAFIPYTPTDFIKNCKP